MNEPRDLPKEFTIQLPSQDDEGKARAPLEIRFRLIPGGSFRMGSRGFQNDEQPVTPVRISDFYLGETPITQAQFAHWRASPAYDRWFTSEEIQPHKLEEEHKNGFPGNDDHPAEQVTWYEANAYARWLTGLVLKSGDASGLPSTLLEAEWRSDLPSEAQWEFACRAGSYTEYFNGDDGAALEQVGVFAKNSRRKTAPVARAGTANRRGIYDLHGNVWEWCRDFWKAANYRTRLPREWNPQQTVASDADTDETAEVWSRFASMMGSLLSGAELVDGDKALVQMFASLFQRWHDDGNARWKGPAEALGYVLANRVWPPDEAQLGQFLVQVARKNAGQEDAEAPPRLLRGCGWFTPAGLCRAACRIGHRPGLRLRVLGFRLAWVPRSGDRNNFRSGRPGGPDQDKKGADRAGGAKERRDAAAGAAPGRGAAAAETAAGSTASAFERANTDIRQSRTNESNEEAMRTAVSAGAESESAGSDLPRRALSSVDGTHWEQGGDADADGWPEQPDPTVVKLVVGELKKELSGEVWKPVIDVLQTGIAKRFPNLTHLHVWGLTDLTRISDLPNGIEYLDIRDCPNLKEIDPIPDGAPIESLDLGRCSALKALPGGNLQTLEYVWLDGCKAIEQFAALNACVPNLKRLELYGCKFKDLDPSYCGKEKQNVAPTLAGLLNAEKTQGKEHLAECKIIVLGNGGVGKTELVRALKELPPIEGQGETEGIHLWNWDGGEDGVPFAPFPEQGVKNVRINIWDFGGQDVYLNMHRLFLENRAIFIVVWRQPNPDGSPFREPKVGSDIARPLNYWLDQIRAANPEARPLIVRTRSELDKQIKPSDWRTEVREEYRALSGFKVCSHSPETDDFGLLRDKLRESVKQELGGAEATLMPKGRAAVRRGLSEFQPSWEEGQPEVVSPRPIMRLHEFSKFVREQYESSRVPAPSESEIRLALEYFQNSGAVFVPAMAAGTGGEMDASSAIVIDQRWLVEGIYELVRDGPARDRLLRTNGKFAATLLDAAWDHIRDQDRKIRYTADTRIVMKQFMVRCGILVNISDGETEKWILPDLLPSRDELEVVGDGDPLVSALRDARDASKRERRLRARHRAFGKGFGCLLVTAMVDRFGNIPVFRFGGMGRLVVDGQRDRSESMVLFEWLKDDEDAFQGELSCVMYGAEHSDEQILAAVKDVMNSIPGWPSDVEFLPDEGLKRAWDQVNRIDDSLRLPPQKNAEPFRVATPKVRLGTIGISRAGEEASDPDLEFWTKALIDELQTGGSNFDVIEYKTDSRAREATYEVVSLVREIASSHLVVCLMGDKYLNSQYCMAEFWAAKKHLEKVHHNVSGEFPTHLKILKLPTAARVLGSSNSADAANKWCVDWIEKASIYNAAGLSEYDSPEKFSIEASGRYVQDQWMRFALGGKDNLRKIFHGLRQHNKSPELNDLAGETPAEKVAHGRQQLKVFAGELRGRMGRIVFGMPAEEKMARLQRRCEQLLAEDHLEEAGECFGQWIQAHHDATSARKSALGNQPLEVTSIENARDQWRKNQGN